MSKEGYFAVQVVEHDAKIINEWLNKHGAPSVTDLHATLMYDTSDPDVEVVLSTETFVGSITGITVLGAADSPWRSLVLSLFSESLEERHLQLREMGFTHSYPIYQPHVSIINIYNLIADIGETATDDIIQSLKQNLHELTNVLPIISLNNEIREKSK